MTSKPSPHQPETSSPTTTPPAPTDAPPAWAPADTPWHPGYPFRPRLSKFRRVGMLALLILLCGVIGGYWYLTDSARVRELAESYLTDVLGGPVRIRHAKLSIFQGLQLDGVEVRVDETDKPDSVIFSAERFDLTYDFRSLVAGDLSATVIRAIDPHVWLTQNLDTGAWNFQRMIPRGTSRPGTQPARRRDLVLPEIVLRNAHVDYSEVRAGAWRRLGSFAIEGVLRPGRDRGDYLYAVQSRGGQTDEMGPTLSGEISMGNGHVSAHVRDFSFGRDVRAMLPAQVRNWWERHKFAGRITSLDLEYWLPGGDRRREQFEVVAAVDGVRIQLHPEEWRTHEQNARRAFLRSYAQMLRRLDGGRPRPATDVLNLIPEALTDVPVDIEHVAGTFVFTRDKIEVRKLTGRVETTALVIDGWMSGYADPGRDPAFEVTVSSGRLENLVIPRSPRWLRALPRPLRNIYDMFKPEGAAAVTVTVGKQEPDADVHYSGRVDIIDGRFAFERFPYPAREGSGVIAFAHDHRTGKDELTMDVRGRGLPDGPNKDTYFHVRGRLAPLTSDMYAHIEVFGENVSNEPALTAAFPANVRKALAFFDADKTGLHPTFHGKFHTNVYRVEKPTRKPDGRKDYEWIVNLDLDIDRAAGKLVAFPYPLSDVSGRLEIREGYVDIVRFGLDKNGAKLDVKGRVSWKGQKDDDDHPYDHNRVEKVALEQDIRVTAKNVPIDEDLLNALPGGKRSYLDKLGVRGTLDLDGKVFTAKGPPVLRPTTQPGDTDDVAYDLLLHLNNGTLRPPGSDFVIDGLTADLRVTPTSLSIVKATGNRAGGDMAASGLIEWPNDQPRAKLHVDAAALPLDAALYGIVPKAVKESWDAISPAGTTDLKLDFRLGYDAPTTRPDAQVATAAATDTAVVPAPDPDVHLVLNPRNLSITTKVVPYRLDKLHGTIEVVDHLVTIPMLTAFHGPAEVRMAGKGTLSKNSQWDLTLAARNLAVDDDFRKALPATLAGLVTSMELGGTMDLDFTKLMYRANPRPVSAGAGASTGATEDSPDIDFAAKIGLRNGKLSAGVPMAGMTGTMDFAGSVRNGTVADLTGSADIATLTIAGRPATAFRLGMRKPADRPALAIETLQAKIAGGELAGQVNLVFPDNAPARYALAIVLRGADVRQMAGKLEERFTGTMNASLDLEGDWNSNASRRGRGDVNVVGDNMVRIPLLMGFLQVTNLSLPSNAPFQQGESRYSVEGNRVTFESIALRARDTLLKGSGWLDFASKKVNLTFVTQNPTINQIPLLNDIVNPLKQELLQFHVRGTLEDPKVAAASLNTITTTVDEVFGADDRGKGKK